MEYIENSKKIDERVSPVRKQYSPNAISARLSGIRFIKATTVTMAINWAINNPQKNIVT
jgi:hypothetical protein